jgi:acyl dehydratase
VNTLATSFDDLNIGAEWRTAERCVDEALIRAFAELSGDRTPVHLQRDAARRAGYEDVVAHGTLVAAVATGLLCEVGNLTASALATRRMEWEFAQPVVAGTRVHCLAKVSAKRIVSAATGLLDLDIHVLDAAGRRLQRGRMRLLVRRR